MIIEEPVGHGKSTYCTLLLGSWHMMVRPDSTTLILSYGSEFATNWSSKVRNLVDRWGPKLFGVHLDPTFKSASHFRLAPPHVGELYGLGYWGGIAGKRADLIVIDDPQKDAEAFTTEESRDKLFKHFMSEILTRLKPNATIIIIQSRRHPEDLSGKLIDMNPELDPKDRWQRHTFPALDEHNQALWPEEWSVERLLRKRHENEVAGTEFVWWAQYQQDPVAAAAEDLDWPASYTDNIYFTDLPVFKPVFKLASLDPSVGKNKKRGDYAALLCDARVDTEGTLWINDPSMLKIPIGELVDLTIGKLKQQRPDGCAIECNNFQDYIADSLLEKYPQAPVWRYINTRGIARAAGFSQGLKEVEIRVVLTKPLREGRIKIRDCPAGRLIGRQLRDFPHGTHDDGPDALVLLIRLWENLLHGEGRRRRATITSRPA